MKHLIDLGIEGYINKGAEAELWDVVEKVKEKLDLFSEDRIDEILDGAPEDVFVGRDPDKDPHK